MTYEVVGFKPKLAPSLLILMLLLLYQVLGPQKYTVKKKNK